MTRGPVFPQEHVIHVWEETGAQFHNCLIQLYCEKVQGLMKEYLLAFPAGTTEAGPLGCGADPGWGAGGRQEGPSRTQETSGLSLGSEPPGAWGVGEWTHRQADEHRHICQRGGSRTRTDQFANQHVPLWSRVWFVTPG